MRSIRQHARKMIPSSLRSRYIMLYEKFLIATVPFRQRKTLRILKSKAKLKVAFFVVHSSVWKCDELYRKMEADERYEPVIVAIPSLSFREGIMQKEINDTFNLFRHKRYNVVKAYNSDTGKWLDVRNDINPDIVVFTNPHELSKKEYSIVTYLDRLTCYIPYTFQVTYLYDFQYNQLFHNLLWKAFYQSSLHKDIASRYARNKGRNVVVTGYPGIDMFRDKSYVPEDRWKIKDPGCKRIIWAPHHSIGDDHLTYSNFLLYHQVLLDIAGKYSGRIQIAFKPHPILRSKLNSESIWGEEKTNLYYNNWNNLPNGQIEESDYIDLFLTSDAMIHDSASFLAEYLSVNKPVLYTVHDENVASRLNDFGRLAFEQHYKAQSAQEIYDFIERIVLTGNDPNIGQREVFIEKYLVPCDGLSASTSIFNEIAKHF